MRQCLGDRRRRSSSHPLAISRKAPMSTRLTTSAPVLAALESVRALAGDDTRELLRLATAEDRAEWLIALQKLTDATASATVLATEVFDASGDGSLLDGSATTAAWIRRACRTTGAAASERVRLARRSRGALSESIQRLTDGSITYEHLQVIDRSTRRLGDDHESDAVELLTTLAESESVRDVRAAGQHLAQVVNPDGALAARERQFERRYLALAPLLDGMTSVNGLLDAESAAIVEAGLRPFLTPEGPTDSRSHAQRQADGLVQIFAAACDAHDVPMAGGERPHLNVVVNAEGLAQLQPRREAMHPLSVARVSCDAHVTALILDTNGTVVDLGRTRRLFSSQQRKLLAARDGGCRWPGCHRPPAHTDAHHVVPWQDGGATDALNAILLCRHHHRLVHEGGWQLVVSDPGRGTHGTVEMIPPRSARLANRQRLTSHPRGP